ncbi:restriction endonuclease subunit S [Burkholderia stagnalis]|uniref:restriction endonuclease subunit S n=1 Tax=Burkholderia stagnalis TaxID=1503054 RepID=UPI00084176DC|nr:restriction endonuclease subunit S [Burkholderia stagnalis]AOK51254.1 hypothetical protein WT74_00040 [Burkholderia stagnalis]
MRLKDGFELVATALDGGPRLRELILSLAVQGKLVPQDSRDEPASVLLEKMNAERENAIREGSLRRGKVASVVGSSSPFELPANWQWARLGQVGDWGAGATPARSNAEYYGGGIPWFKSGELKSDYVSRSEETITQAALNECSLRLNKAGDVLIAMYGATIGKTAILSSPATTNQAICACTPFTGLDSRYLLLLLRSMRSYFISLGAGGAQPNISREKIIASVIALPPTAEQVRIIAKVDELMRLCDELETQGRLEAEQHARLTATLLDALAASESSHELSENWARVAAHFDLLLDRPEAVDAFEQTILRLAVRGLLTRQNPGDEPASELLKQVRAEKDSLIAEGLIRRDKPLQEIDENSLPYEVPDGWVSTRFGSVILDSEAGWSPSCENVPRASGQWGVLKVSAVSWGQFRSEENKTLPAGLIPKPEYEVASGDFLLSRANTDELVARSVVVEATEPKLMISDKIIRLKLSTLVDPQYLNLFNNSTVSRGYYIAHASGTSSSMKNVAREVILNLPIALPPAAEQARIVARVGELRRLCASLRVHLTARQTCQARFAEAVVGQAASAVTLRTGTISQLPPEALPAAA